MDICGWDVEIGWSVVSVMWVDGIMNVYCVGYKGKVDFKCVGEVVGGFYYKDYFLRFGKLVEL